jgi:hypothetical protein
MAHHFCMENPGYLYCITHEPTGLMYVGSRKGDPDGDHYLGSPAGKNKMRELFDTRDISEFEKDVLFVSDYDSIVSGEPGLIKAMMDEYGDMVTNICVAFPPPPMRGEDNPYFGLSGKDMPTHGTHPKGENHQNWGLFGADHPAFGSKHTDEEIERRRVAMAGCGNPFHGKNHTSETVNGLSKTIKAQFASGRVNHMTGKNHTEEAKQKNRDAHMGAGNVRSKAVRNLLNMKVYDSGRELARELGIHHSFISQWIKHPERPLIFEKDYIDGMPIPSGGLKITPKHMASIKEVVNLETGERWPSLTQAANACGVTPSSMHGWIHKESKPFDYA